MKHIPLTKNKVAIIDDVDFENVSKFKWHCFSQKGYVGRDSSRTEGKKKILLHRFIMNPPESMEVDHINGDVLDNRRCNLRICTHMQNCSNHKGYSNHKGVYKIKNRPLKKPYIAQIMVNGKHIHVGYFKSLEEAVVARNYTARKLLGDFANI